jgi:hypothetical protein
MMKMKRMIVFVLLVVLFLSACAGPAGPVAGPTEVPPTEPPAATPVPTDPPGADESAAAQRAALEALAAWLGIDVSAITVADLEAVEWPDSCLGIVRINAMCAQGIVPGYRMTLDASGQLFQMHTNADGSAYTLAPVSAGAEAEAAERAALAALARALGLADYEMVLVSSTPVEWSNACLGIEEPGEMCAEVITPGYQIVVEFNGVLHQYHTNQDGSVVRPATIALTWERVGGIAGFCDALRVYRSGEVVVHECGFEGVVTTGVLAELLSQDDVAQFVHWVREYGEMTVDHSNTDAAADGMRLSLTWAGAGTEVADDETRNAMMVWVQDLYNQVSP